MSAIPSSHCSQPDISSLFVTTYFSSGSGSHHSHVLVKFGTRDKKVWAKDWPATGNRMPVLMAAQDYTSPNKYWSVTQDVFLGGMNNPQKQGAYFSPKQLNYFFSRQHINSDLYTNIYIFPAPLPGSQHILLSSKWAGSVHDLLFTWIHIDSLVGPGAVRFSRSPVLSYWNTVPATLYSPFHWMIKPPFR